MQFSSISDLRNAATTAIGQLSKVREEGGRVFVDLPVSYPSGANTALEVSYKESKFRVSDNGSGLVEADYMAASEHFIKQGADLCADEGLTLEAGTISSPWIELSQLPAALCVVANISARSAQGAVLAAIERKERSFNEEIYDKISHIFGTNNVKKTIELKGQRSDWKVRNVVTLQRRPTAIFEWVSLHHASVASKFLMFSDLRSNSTEISLNAVVQSTEEMHGKQKMIADVANIVPFSATPETIRKLAEAA